MVWEERARLCGSGRGLPRIETFGFSEGAWPVGKGAGQGGRGLPHTGTGRGDLWGGGDLWGVSVGLGAVCRVGEGVCGVYWWDQGVSVGQGGVVRSKGVCGVGIFGLEGVCGGGLWEVSVGPGGGCGAERGLWGGGVWSVGWWGGSMGQGCLWSRGG